MCESEGGSEGKLRLAHEKANRLVGLTCMYNGYHLPYLVHDPGVYAVFSLFIARDNAPFTG